MQSLGVKCSKLIIGSSYADHKYVLRDSGVDVFARHKKHHSPHIHVRYTEFNVSIEIPSGEILEGSLPSKQMKLVQAWIVLHADELMADWELASSGESPYKIEPLR